MIRKALYALALLVASGSMLAFSLSQKVRSVPWEGYGSGGSAPGLYDGSIGQIHPAYGMGDQLDLGIWRVKSLTLDGFTYYASATPPDHRAVCKDGQTPESHGCWQLGYHGSKSFVALRLPDGAEQVCVDTESGERCWWRNELARIATDPPEYGDEIRSAHPEWAIVPVPKATRTDRPMRWRAYVRLPERTALADGMVTR